MPRIKKEDEFYTMLKELASLITDAAEEYNGIVCDFPGSMSRIPQMKVYESNADERVKAVMAKLYTSFITPIDREDISTLALAMDDVVDSMYGVAVRLDLFNMSDLRLEARQISELTVHAVNEMKNMIDHLPDYKKDRVVLEKAIAEPGDERAALRRAYEILVKISNILGVSTDALLGRQEGTRVSIDVTELTPKQRSIVQDTVDIFIAYNQTGREQPDPACGEKPVSDSKKYGRYGEINS